MADILNNIANLVPHQMSRRRYRVVLALILCGGAGLRLWVASTTFSGPDIWAARLVRGALSTYGLAAYDHVGAWGWNYPPGLFPWVLGANWFSHHVGLPYTTLFRLPAIAADLALAWIVQASLAGRASVGLRLLAAALVAFSPLLIAVSAYQAQIDSLAILPAVVAFIVWDRYEGARWRPYLVGGLIGLGATIKTPPLLLVLALLPVVPSIASGAKLTLSAVAVPLLALTPFLINGSDISHVLAYHGGAGEGGISLLVGPRLAPYAFGVAHGLPGPPRGQVDRMLSVYQASRFIFGTGLLIVAAALFRYRPPPVRGAILLWLTVYALGVTFFMQYLVWALPFLLLAGYVRPALVAQLVLLAPIYVAYPAVHALGRHPNIFLALYTIPILLIWLASAVALIFLTIRWCSPSQHGSAAGTPDHLATHARVPELL